MMISTSFSSNVLQHQQQQLPTNDGNNNNTKQLWWWNWYHHHHHHGIILVLLLHTLLLTIGLDYYISTSSMEKDGYPSSFDTTHTNQYQPFSIQQQQQRNLYTMNNEIDYDNHTATTHTNTTTTYIPQTIFVTGGAGFIGSHVCEYLLLRGDTIIIIDEMNHYYNIQQKLSNIQHILSTLVSSDIVSSSLMIQQQAQPQLYHEEEHYYDRLHIYYGDICNTTLLSHIFTRHSNITMICHMAARAGVRPSIQNPYIYIHSNIVGTITLLQYAIQYHITNFVFASSSSVYGGSNSTYFSETEQVDYPISPYAASKKSCELLSYVYAYLFSTYSNSIPMSIIALRFFTVYGPRGRPDMAPYKFIHHMSQSIPIQQYGNGSTSRDYTYITDIVSGIVNALDYSSTTTTSSSTPSSNGTPSSSSIIPTPTIATDTQSDDQPMMEHHNRNHNNILQYHIFNLGKGSGTTLYDFMTYVQYYTNTTPIITILPEQPGDVPYTCANISYAQQMIHYHPQISFQQGIQSTVIWYQSTHNISSTTTTTTTTNTTIHSNSSIMIPSSPSSSISLGHVRRRLQKSQLLENSNKNNNNHVVIFEKENELYNNNHNNNINHDYLDYDDEMTHVIVSPIKQSISNHQKQQQQHRHLQEDISSHDMENITATITNNITNTTLVYHTRYKKVFISGSHSFIGSYIVDTLLLRGDDVIILMEDNDDDGTNNPYTQYLLQTYTTDTKFTKNSGTPTSPMGKLSIYNGTIQNTTYMNEIFTLEQPEWVIHIHPEPQWYNPNDRNNNISLLEFEIMASKVYIQQQIDQLVHLLELCKGIEYGGVVNIQNFIITSSYHVYGYDIVSTIQSSQSKAEYIHKLQQYWDSNQQQQETSTISIPFHQQMIQIYHETDRVDYPKSSYGAIIKSSELFAYTYHHLYSIPISIVRLYNVYGPRYSNHSPSYQLFDYMIQTSQMEQDFNMISYDTTIFGNTMDYTYIDDVVDGMISALDHPNEYDIYNIGDGVNCSLNFISMIQSIMNHSSSNTTVSSYDIVQHMNIISTNTTIIDGIACSNIQKAHDMLQYQSIDDNSNSNKQILSIQEKVQRTIEWHQKNEYNYPPRTTKNDVHSILNKNNDSLFLSSPIIFDTFHETTIDRNNDTIVMIADDNHQYSNISSNTTTIIVKEKCPKEIIYIHAPTTLNTHTNTSILSIWLRRFAFIQWFIIMVILILRIYYKKTCITTVGNYNNTNNIATTTNHHHHHHHGRTTSNTNTNHHHHPYRMIPSSSSMSPTKSLSSSSSPIKSLSASLSPSSTKSLGDHE